jgi:hypothetical protein
MKEKQRNNTPDIILIALLQNYTIRGAAAATGMNERTVENYLAKPDFMQRYNEARADVMRGVCGALQDQMNDAVKVMADLMNDTSQLGAVRLNAAKGILEQGYKYSEATNTVNRLTAIEQVLSGEVPNVTPMIEATGEELPDDEDTQE